MFARVVIRLTFLHLFLIKFSLIPSSIGGQVNSRYCGQQFFKEQIKSYSDFNFRIVGGVPAQEGEFPWVVSLQRPNRTTNKFNHFCGGAIISDYHIITAAHCADKFVGHEYELRIKLGANNVKDINDGIYMRVAQIIVHEHWDEVNNLNDIAIYKTDRPIKYSIDKESGRYSVNSICLPRKSYPDPDLAMVVGWGQISTDGSKVMAQLQKAVVPKFSLELCRQNYRHLGKVNKNMVCYGGDGEKDSCLGDSGGPLISKIDDHYFLVGVVSYGVPCAVEDYPTIYTKVIKYLDWIYAKIKFKTK